MALQIDAYTYADWTIPVPEPKELDIDGALLSVKRLARARYVKTALLLFPETINTKQSKIVIDSVSKQIAEESGGAINRAWLKKYLTEALDKWWEKWLAKNR